MNVLDRAKQITHGVQSVTEWLGSGGQVVDYETAQSRAIVCLECPKNVGGWAVTNFVAMAIKRHLQVKNKLNLKVQGERKLKTCSACGCVLRLLVWEPQDRVRNQITEEELKRLPEECWKPKP